MSALGAEVDRVNDLYDQFEPISARLRTDKWVVPTNLASEKARILDGFSRTGEVSAPHFEYLPMPPARRAAVAEALEFLAIVQRRRSPAASRLARSIDSQVRVQSDHDLHDPTKITTRTADTFGTPDSRLLAEAQELLRVRTDDDEPMVSSSVAAEELRGALTALALDRWTVEVSDEMSARMSVNGPLRRLRVRLDASFSREEVKRLLIHEIGTHVARYEAGACQPARFLRTGSSNYLQTEEGLACYNERRWGVANATSFQTYAARVVAIDEALRHGFTQVLARLLTEGISADRAFDIAVRSKRGFDDVEEPGAHCKDLVYLSGYRLVEAGATDGAPDARLEVGKVSSDDFELLADLDGAGLLAPPAMTSADVARLL